MEEAPKSPIHIINFYSFFSLLFYRSLRRWCSHFKDPTQRKVIEFRQGWKASWKRYCSRVFHKHSDQYYQILNMGRNHRLWRAIEVRRMNKGKKTQDLLPKMLTEIIIFYISKLAPGERCSNKIQMNAHLLIPFYSLVVHFKGFRYIKSNCCRKKWNGGTTVRGVICIESASISAQLWFVLFTWSWKDMFFNLCWNKIPFLWQRSRAAQWIRRRAMSLKFQVNCL